MERDGKTTGKHINMPLKDPILINPSENSSGGSGYRYTTNAIGDGSTNAQPQLQADIDYCVANGISALFIPKGVYKINKPLVIYKNNGSGGYAQVTLKFFGEASMWDSFNTSVIHTNFADAFALGIQQGKGVTIEGITITGLFNPIVPDDRTFYNRGLSDCTDGVCRQSRYSPNAGIALDPFSNGQIPSDGGYPNWTSWYKGSGGTSGSTATTINNCVIASFPVGVVSSPNGFTQNDEITTISNTKFANCPLWISGGQAQEKENRIINVAGWSETHTCFATGVYGAGQPGQWSIDGVNIAGRCNRFINNIQGGFFPTYINGVYAEGIGTFGYIGTGYVGAKVSNSLFDFVSPDISGYNTKYVEADNILFEGCTFRHYGYNYPIPIRAAHCVFQNCGFTGMPFQPSEGSNPGSTSVFRNCLVGGTKLGVNGIVDSFTGYGSRMFPYGHWTLEDNTLTKYGFHLRLKGEIRDTYVAILTNASANLTLSNYSFTFTTTVPLLYDISRAAMLKDGSGNVFYGIVTAISGSQITVSYCTQGMANGVYDISPIYTPTLVTFMGDINSGSNVIQNVKIGWGSLAVGSVFLSTYSSKWLRVIAVNGTSYTVSESLTTTKIAAYFGFDTRQELCYDNPAVNPNTMGAVIVATGDVIKCGGNADNATVYKITKTGFLIPPTGDTRQATWTTPV